MTRPQDWELEGIRNTIEECADIGQVEYVPCGACRERKLFAEIDALVEENKKLRSFIEEFIMGRGA